MTVKRVSEVQELRLQLEDRERIIARMREDNERLRRALVGVADTLRRAELLVR
jgi:hypothetical protein